MRQFLAVAVLGATLAFNASAALAGEKVDYVPSYQPARSVSIPPAQSVSIVSRTEPVQSVVAGGRNTTATDVYRQLRDDNKESKPF